MNIGLCHHSQ